MVKSVADLPSTGRFAARPLPEGPKGEGKRGLLTVVNDDTRNIVGPALISCAGNQFAHGRGGLFRCS